MICIGNLNRFNQLQVGKHTSRNINTRERNINTLDYNMLQQIKFTASDENESIGSKDIFNFSPSDAKKMSPIAIDPESPPKDFTSPQEVQRSQVSEHLTPQEIEEYYYLKQKQAELEQRIREIEQKKLNSGKLCLNSHHRLYTHSALVFNYYV